MKLLGLLAVVLLAPVHAQTIVSVCLNYPTTITFTSYTTVYETLPLKETSVSSALTTASNSEPLTTTTTVDQIIDGPDGILTSTATFTTASDIPTPTTSITTSRTTTFSITTEDVPSTTTTTSTSTSTSPSVSSSDSLSTRSVSDVTPTTTSTSTSWTTLVPEPQSTSVYITVGTADNVLARRAVQYVAFNGTVGYLVYDIEEAALVTLFSNGTMVFGGRYVTGIPSGNQTLLGLSETMPTTLATWNTDDTGNIIISGTEGFCMDASTSVVVKTAFIESTCTILQLAIVAENLSVSTTPFISSTTTSSMTSDTSTTTTMTSTSVSSSNGVSSDGTITSSFLTSTSSEEPTTTSIILTSTETTTLSSSTTTSTSTTSSMLILDSSTSTSTTSTITTTTTTTTATTTSAAPTCAVTDSSMLVVANGDIDPSAYTNLFISTTAVLNYADAPPGQNAVSIQIGTIYPQVMFENSAYLTQITCQDDMITTVVTDEFASSFVANWPQTDFIIITNSESCNSQTQRGVYLVNSHTLDTSTSTFTFSVTAAEWGAVSETMTISYGTVTSSSDEADPVYSSTCTNTLSVATMTTTTTSTTSSSTSLSPGAQAMLQFIKKQLAYDPDENQMLVASNPKPVIVGGGNDVVTDPELLDKLRDILQQDGLPDLDDLLDEAKDATDSGNICETPLEPPRICVAPASCTTSTGARRRSRRNANMSVNALDLMPRDFHSHLEERSLEDVLEYVCSDWAELLLSPFEQIAQIQEIICGLKEAYDAAQDLYKLIKCLANPFCFNPPTVTIAITYPPSTRWTYTYKWSASWSGLNGYTIVYGNPQNYIRCSDCSFSISDLTIDGAITYNVSAQTVTEARNTLRMSSVARLIMNLETNGPWTGKGTAFQSSLSLGNNQIDSMFSFSPVVVFSIGAQASANAPVSSIGGAVLSFNGAIVDLNYPNKAASNANGWQPAIQMTYPGFKNDAKINFSPVMATDVRIQMNVLKGVLNSYSAVTNQLAIGFDASYSEIATSSCGTQQLALISYVSSQGNAIFDGSAPQLLNKAVSNNPVKCYNVPQYFPTSEEISALAQVGGDFCTSFIAYRAPISTIVTGTVTSLLSQTIETTTSISTTTDISTSTITETLSTSLVATVSVTERNTVSVGGGSDSLIALQKRSPSTAVPQLVRRDPVATPAMVTTWENDKISYACSQIATGTKTTTLYTSTSTTYTSTSTNTVTATRFVGIDGPVASVTVTTTRYIVTSMSSSTIALADPTTVTTECPLQTQAACFKVKAYGVDLIEGQYIGTGLFPDRGFSVLGANSNPNDGIFYLDNTGKLISAMNREPLSYIQTTVALNTGGDFLGVPCNPAYTYGTPGVFPGASGCSENCPCDQRPGGTTAICVDDIYPNNVQRIPCTDDSVCPPNTLCSITYGSCDSYSTCTSTYGNYVESFWPGQALMADFNSPAGASQLQNTPIPGAQPATAKCQIDCNTFVLTCTGPQDLTQLYIFDPAGKIANKNYVQGYPGWPNGLSDMPFRVMWQTVPYGWEMLPVYLTAEEATCPCRY